MEEKLDKKMLEYAKRFGDGFPAYQVGGSDEEMLDAINLCLMEGKDAYELGLVNDDEDY